MADLDAEYWFVALLHRDDLKDCGYDASKVDDDTMGKLSDLIEEEYRGSHFIPQLIYCADRLGIPVRGEK